jgi:uncharacterized damage-inducible protein DinB
VSESLLDSIPAVRRMIAYDQWANRRTLESLRAVEVVPQRARLWLPHIVGAQREWLARLQGLPCNVPIWPDWTIDDTAAQLESLYDLWKAYLDDVPAPALHHPIEYKNSQGESYSNTPAEIMPHILLHSHYHRGQIAAEIRSANGTPAISDFIFALRDPDYSGRALSTLR